MIEFSVSFCGVYFWREWEKMRKSSETDRRGRALQERRFSVRAERVLRGAQAAALELGHGYVGCEHLLLGMLREEEDAPGRALRALGVLLEENGN